MCPRLISVLRIVLWVSACDWGGVGIGGGGPLEYRREYYLKLSRRYTLWSIASEQFVSEVMLMGNSKDMATQADDSIYESYQKASKNKIYKYVLAESWQ